MADGFLPGLLGAILANLNTLILQEVGLACNCKKELRKLRSILSTIQAVLHDAEQKETRSEVMRNWLRKLKDAAYDADDLLDAYGTDVLSMKQKGEFSLLNSFVLHIRMGAKIREIRERLDGIAKERSDFHLKDGMVEELVDTGDRNQTHSFVIESDIYGREEDKRNIVNLLMDGHDPRIRLVIPIVGMGGIGKTTVAQLVYNDNMVKDHFDLRIWVCVSEHFNERRLQQAIIESVSGNKCDINDVHPMIYKLTEMLLGKRFLLVLDNVWSEDHEMWDRFKQVVFKCGVMGSKVIVTTRSEKVAIILGNVNPYHLEVLSDDDCWSLFEQRAFGTSREKKPNLVAIGKEIVKKCKGVPLAAKALGSMMCFKNDEKQWLFIKDSEIWNLPDDENVILPALKLSYSHLSPHLKQCFAYCSIFPKGYVIKKYKLILLWMANGFIPTKGKMTLEDIGSEIFNDLLMRSFFQGIKEADDGTITKCKMHDLVSDLAQYITRKECFIFPSDLENVDIEMARHLCCDMRPLLRIPSGLYKARSLRTFLLLSINARYISSKVPPDITNFKCLRVLSLSHAGIYELPISICNLKHVRYLDLSYTNISTLPESLDNLQNLQTLVLKYCERLYKLPKRLRNIVNLRHIIIKGCTSLTQMPPQIGRLTQLQTLSYYIVGKEGSRIGELQSLNLRGKLHIKELENVLNGMDAREANLIYKQGIRSLGLSWKEDDGAKSENDHEEVLEALQPYQNLKRFYLEKYMGLEIPSWMKSPFISNLVEISLVKCRNITKLPQLGKLPCLKILSMEGIDSLQYIDSEFYGDDMSRGIPFSSLEKFTLIELPNLERWHTQEIREQFPRLSKLIIKKCFKLRDLPYIMSLQSLVLEDCNEKLLLSFEKNFASLSSLLISGFLEMESLPTGMLGHLRRLRSLKIKDCPRVKHLSRDLKPFLVSDRRVSIWNCGDLTSISEDTRLEHDSGIGSSSLS